MKKILLHILLILFVFDGYSQYKGNPNKAKATLDKLELKTDIDEIRELLTMAKGEVDAAIENVKQNGKANTWLIRGDVYAEIAKILPELDSEAIEKLFTPEFRNRLDSVIGFSALPPEVISKVVDKFIMELEFQLDDRNVMIELTENSREWLAKRGYDQKFGARPLGRVIQEHIKKPLAEELLFGKLAKGGVVIVDVEGGKPVFKYPESTKLATKRKKSKSPARRNRNGMVPALVE